MVDAFLSLFHRLSSAAGEPVAVVVELVLIGLAVNWFASRLEGTRGTRPLRNLLLVLLIVTLGVRLMTVQFGWARLDILYRYFVIAVAFTTLAAFQPELRRAFMRVGELSLVRRSSPQSRLISALVASAGYLSRNKYGAVIAIQRDVDLRGWAENGTVLNAEVSANLLNSIFFPNSPLHDLGTIIRDSRVIAANCQFPSAESEEIDASLGSRHLAAIGMSYESDALVLVVSEETGTISLADNGKLTRYLTLDDLERELESRLSGVAATDSEKRRKRGRLSVSWLTIRRFLMVAPLTLVIWYLADQATQVDVDNVQIVLRPQPPQNLQVELFEPRTARFTVKLRGSNRAIENLRRRGGAGDVLTVDWQLPDWLARPGEYDPLARGVLQQVADIRDLGLVVRDVQPESMRLRIDELVSHDVPVRVDSGPVVVADVQVNPPEVRVTLPRRVWDQLGEEQRVVVAPVASRVAMLDPDQVERLDNVPLALRLGDVTLTAVEPRTVNVLLRVVAQTNEFVIENVRVRLSFSSGFWPQYDEENYQLVMVEPLEWRIRELKVRSEEGDVRRLTEQDVDAFVLVTPDLFSSVGTELTRDVTIILPRGVTLAGPTPQVRLRLIERQRGGTP
jgi:diadenylate cyclase